MPAESLALFDLDHTLIPFDSGMAWTRFLVRRGVLAAQAQDEYLQRCHQYVAGTLDIRAMHRANLRPLLRFPHSVLVQWQREFEREMGARIPVHASDLVRRHRQAGHLCAIVTATERLIAEPFARLFGVDALVATQAATADASPEGELTGELDGPPCYRQHKVERVGQWLAARPGGSASTIAAFAQSWFYSDSMNDLPLLAAVSHPVAVCPDVRLREHAKHAGWPVLEWP